MASHCHSLIRRRREKGKLPASLFRALTSVFVIPILTRNFERIPTPTHAYGKRFESDQGKVAFASPYWRFPIGESLDDKTFVARS
jgi:hypothetical protein